MFGLSMFRRRLYSNFQKNTNPLIQKIKRQRAALISEKRNDFLFEAYRKDFEYAESIKLPSAEFSYGLFASKRLRASVAQGRHLVTIKLKTQ